MIDFSACVENLLTRERTFHMQAMLQATGSSDIEGYTPGMYDNICLGSNNNTVPKNGPSTTQVLLDGLLQTQTQVEDDYHSHPVESSFFVFRMWL